MTSISLFMILLSLLFLVFIIRLIRKSTFTLENSLLWLGIGIIMLLFSIFPDIPEYFSRLFGFETMSINQNDQQSIKYELSNIKFTWATMLFIEFFTLDGYYFKIRC